MSTENGKTKERLKFILNLSQRLDLKSSKINKLKIIVPTWNDEFELLDGYYSVPDIQDYIEYIIKSMKH